MKVCTCEWFLSQWIVWVISLSFFLYFSFFLGRRYLLEKSRVVYQSDNEQNFHVFYLFFAGLREQDRDLYEVGAPDRHRYLAGNRDALAK